MKQLDLQQRLEQALEEAAYYKPKYLDSQKAVSEHWQTIQKLENQRDALQQQVNGLAARSNRYEAMYRDRVEDYDNLDGQMAKMQERAESAEAELERLKAQEPVDTAAPDGEKTVITHFFAPEGWKLVPVEPSWEMLSADGCKEHHNGQPCAHHENRKRIWCAMLGAAPAP